jgi:hypothetical protein
MLDTADATLILRLSPSRDRCLALLVERQVRYESTVPHALL